MEEARGARGGPRQGAPVPAVRIASVGLCARLSTSEHGGSEIMRSATSTVRVDAAAKKRLERLAKSTGRSRSFLAAEAINQCLDVNEWQVSGITRTMASPRRRGWEPS